MLIEERLAALVGEAVSAAIDAGAMEQRKEELEMRLEGQRQAPSHFAESVRQLTSEFALLLERFSVPRFPGVTEPSTIDLRNYQPVLYGRRFDELSSQGLIVVVNVAHAYRKMNDFDNSIEWYERALSLAPKCASTHTALGFTYQLKGNFQTNMGEAIECYHK